jgi:hypothetical protein
MKRKRPDEMVQTAVRLPQSLRDRLSKAGGEGGVGEEIRRRLEASFEAEKYKAGPKMRDLLAAIASFSAEVTEFYGDPTSDPFAADLLKACMDLLFKSDRPSGDANPQAHPQPESAAEMLYGPDHPIETISKTIVAGWLRDRARRAPSDREKGE